MTEILKFFIKEEWKGRYHIVGAFLFIFVAVLMAYLALPGMDSGQFSALFWILVVFTTLQGISKPFMQMRKADFAFWHQLCSPEVFLSARLISAYILMLIFTLFTYGLFSLMNGTPDGEMLVFLVISVLTCTGIASVFTISSSMAVKTDQAGVLLPVMSFPAILPVILVGVKAGKKTFQGMGFDELWPDLVLLLSLDVLLFVLGLLLIRFIWKD